jgi:hypothetical protein
MKENGEAMRQRIQMTRGEPVDLWRSPVVHEDRLDNLIAKTARGFESAGAPITEESGLLSHLKATVVCAAASPGKEIDEASYMRALQAVSDPNGRRTADTDVVAVNCAKAKALGDYAQELLKQRGVRWESPDFETQYIAAIENAAREFGLSYHGRR